MRALVKEGSRLQLQELPVPLPAADEVLIRVRAAGLCRTDALVMAGQLPAANPLIPGHELAGEVAGYGPATRGWRLGEPVTVHPQIGCGTCGACAGRRPANPCPARPSNTISSALVARLHRGPIAQRDGRRWPPAAQVADVSITLKRERFAARITD